MSLTLCLSIVATLPNNAAADHNGPGCKNCWSHHGTDHAQHHAKGYGDDLLEELRRQYVIQLNTPCIALLEQLRQQPSSATGTDSDCMTAIVEGLIKKLDSIEQAVKASQAPATAANAHSNSVEHVLEQLRSVQSDLDGLQAELDEAEKKRADLHSEYQKQQAELDGAQKAREDLLKSKGFWGDLKAGAEESLKRLDDPAQGDASKIDTARKQISAHAALKCKEDVLPQEIAKLKADVDALDERIKELETLYTYEKARRDKILNAPSKSAHLDIQEPARAKFKSIFRFTSYSDKPANLPAPNVETNHVVTELSGRVTKHPAKQLAELAGSLANSETQKAKIKAFSDLTKLRAREYFEARQQILEATDAWKSENVVTSCVFDKPATFQDPGRTYESGSSAVLREGMRFSSDGYGNWMLEAPYTAGMSPSEIHMQLRITMADNTQQTLTLKPICLPARSHCTTKGCTGSAPCATSDHSGCSSTLKLKGYLPALDNSNGVFESVDRKGYAVYGAAYSAK